MKITLVAVLLCYFTFGVAVPIDQEPLNIVEAIEPLNVENVAAADGELHENSSLREARGLFHRRPKIQVGIVNVGIPGGMFPKIKKRQFQNYIELVNLYV